MEIAKLFDVRLRDDVRPDGEHLSKFDEAGTKRRDRLCQLSRPCPMRLIRYKTRRPGQYPSAAVAEEGEKKRRKAIPDDKNSENHLNENRNTRMVMRGKFQVRPVRPVN